MYMVEKNQWCCALTGIKFDPYERAFTPSIDRIDSSRGYTQDNVRVVCLAINYAINEWPIEKFEAIVNAYIKHNNLKTTHTG